MDFLLSRATRVVRALLCLSLAGMAGVTQAATCNTAFCILDLNSTLWVNTISATSGGYFRLTPVSSSGSALDVSGVSTADGANVHQWAWTGSNNQPWIFQTP